MKMVLSIIFLMNLLNSCKNAEPATYYLPENYEGPFAVVYSQSEGGM
jgi:hypothetical protein